MKEKIKIKNIYNNLDCENNKKEEKNINLNVKNFYMKERYNGLQYNENEIFYSNYDKFISDQINCIKKNKIKNYQTEIESSFYDLNEKEIKIILKSIKINFYPEVKSKNPLDNNNFSIYLPLSFIFLFYYNDDINYFEKILLSMIYFQKDFKKINFNDEGLYELLNKIENIKEKMKKENSNELNYLSNDKKRKKSINNLCINNIINSNIINKKEGSDKDLKNSFNKTYNHLGSNNFTNKFEKRNSIKIDNKKIKIIHSNCKIRNKIYNIYLTEENRSKIADKGDINLKKNENNINENDNFYNEYNFIWETPDITYKVKIEMPKILFLYEDLDYKIVTYYKKNLFLYLYKNNFINWDFYVLNYFFSIKTFRELMLKFFSFSKEYILIKSLLGNKNKIKNLKNISIIKNIESTYNLFLDEEDKNSNKNIFLIKKKIYNQMDENNEIYTFFYSDPFQKNYIINFYSYHIKINYQKLNPKLKWEFFLNIKQMRYLNEISKYSSLISFLPKIIKTNSQNGNLFIDFTILGDNFDAKILQNVKKVGNNSNNEMNIEINKPYLKVEKFFLDNNKNIKI